MKIFEKTLKPIYPNLIDSAVAPKLILCITGLRVYFDIPTKRVIKEKGLAYSIAVYDRKVVEAIKVRKSESKRWLTIGNRLQVETKGKWKTIENNFRTEDVMLNLFKKYGKKYLYVRMSEV